MRWNGLAGCCALLLASQVLVGCGDDEPGPVGVGGSSSGGSASAGKDAGGEDSGGSTSEAGKGGSNAGGGGSGAGGSAGGTGGSSGSGGTGGQPCTASIDCYTDNNPCTADTCVGGKCEYLPDNDATCPDTNDCTDDVCEEGECKHTNNTAACNDGNECTDADKCEGGACKGTNNTADCDDLSTCTPGQDKCAEGVCSGTRDTTVCPVCATADNLIKNCDFSMMLDSWVATDIAFEGGVATQSVVNERDIVDITAGGPSLYCVQPRQEPLALKQGFRYEFGLVAGSDVPREAAVALTQAAGMYTVYSVGDSPAGGFKVALDAQMKPFNFEFLMTEPDDANVKLEIKVGGPASTPNKTYIDDVYLREVKCTDAASCDDGNLCTTDTCDAVSGKCTFAPLTDGASCDTDEESCTADVCNAGKCVPTTLADGAACESDDNACTDDKCSGGMCSHPSAPTCVCGDATDCDDLNPCTTDSCSASACAHVVDTAAVCDDLNDCTPVDSCGATGTCGGTNICGDCTTGGNLLTNCNLADATGTGWLPGFFGGAGTQSVTDGRLVVNITNGGTAGYMVQPRQEGIVLTKGTTYVVKWNALASIARKMYVSITQNGDPFKSYGSLEVDLTTSLGAYSFEFTMTDDPPAQNVKFEIQLGGGAPYNPTVPNSVTLDNLSLAPKAP
ncbi:MAG: hypothetical protein K0R38_296 [Polyangiaceae bacterium]|jgi:hypothetical protein|nr:hypothetical protein [Polyangiaceae bacterium]